MDSETPSSCSTAADASEFAELFRRLTGHDPFRWQQRLYDRFVVGDLPTALDLPTGLGKTSVMAIWLLARSDEARAVKATLPRRLVYVVDRRVVVDQATEYAETLRRNAACALGIDDLPISTLRGRFVDNRAWLGNPACPAIMVGTIDMVGSRLLFEGYGVSPKMRPYQAGLLGADTLVVLDEAHLCPPFQDLLSAIETDDALKPKGETRRAIVPSFRMLPLSATGGDGGDRPFRLEPGDWDREAQPEVHQRYTAGKRLKLHDTEKPKLAEALAERAWEVSEDGKRVLVYCHSREVAQKVEKSLQNRATDRTELIVGARRVHERDKLAKSIRDLGFSGEARPQHRAPVFLVATSAGEVGVDIDADHMVCDLVAYERMVQRLGRVNRRGGDGRTAMIDVFCVPPEPPKAEAKDDAKTRQALAAVERFEAAKAVLGELPQGTHGHHDASPQAFVALKQTHPDLVAKATTPAPLRPALDRAVVDAWSLTSLPEHPGRPEPEPWLRGWVEDDEPQAQVIWRRFLPWRRRVDEDKPVDAPVRTEVEGFFDAARPHASEILEAPAWQVAATLIIRAAALAGRHAAAASPSDGAAPPKRVTADGIIVLTSARELKGFRTLGDLTALAGKGKVKRDVEDLVRLMSNGIVIVSASLGGINDRGLLHEDAGGLGEDGWPGCLDDGWDPAETGVRLRAPGTIVDERSGWREAYRFILGDGEADEPPVLAVDVWRGTSGERAGDPALSRRAQRLDEHGAWAAEEAGRLADALGLEPGYRAMLQAAAWAHDLGKARDLWQNAMRAPRDRRRPYAKTTAAADPARLRIGPYTYRHEFGSLRDVEANPAALADVPEELRELALHLIAAHHGYARPLIAPVDPTATPADSEARAAAAALRFARLQRDWGPWGLAWWEALLRAADWRASARNDMAREGDEPAAGTRPAAAEVPA